MILMVEEHTFTEMIRIMGGLETSVTNLNKNIDTFGTDLKALTSSCQSFEMYTKTRANLPERINAVEDSVAELQAIPPKVERLTEKVDFLIKRYDAAMIAAAVLNAIAIAVVWLVQQGYIKVGV